MWDELPSSASTRLERHHRALECAIIGLRVDPHGVQAAVPEQRRYRRQIHRPGATAATPASRLLRSSRVTSTSTMPIASSWPIGAVTTTAAAAPPRSPYRRSAPRALGIGTPWCVNAALV